MLVVLCVALWISLLSGQECHDSAAALQVTRGNAARGNATRGNATRGNATRGNAAGQVDAMSAGMSTATGTVFGLYAQTLTQYVTGGGKWCTDRPGHRRRRALEESITCDNDWVEAWQTFKITSHPGNGRFTFIGGRGQKYCSDSSVRRRGGPARMMCNRDNPYSWEKFGIIDASSRGAELVGYGNGGGSSGKVCYAPSANQVTCTGASPPVPSSGTLENPLSESWRHLWESMWPPPNFVDARVHPKQLVKGSYIIQPGAVISLRNTATNKWCQVDGWFTIVCNQATPADIRAQFRVVATGAPVEFYLQSKLHGTFCRNEYDHEIIKCNTHSRGALNVLKFDETIQNQDWRILAVKLKATFQSEFRPVSVKNDKMACGRRRSAVSSSPTVFQVAIHEMPDTLQFR